MIIEMTNQVRVSNMQEGQRWYAEFFQREPDFAPHDGIAEWEIIPGSWLQLADGTPAEGSGPLRLGVTDIELEKERIVKELNVENFEIQSREEVPVKWATFTDPWGNRLGLFEYLSKDEQRDRIKLVLGKLEV